MFRILEKKIMLWYYYDDVDDELNLNNLLFFYLFLNLRILKYDIIVMYFVFLILNKYINDYFFIVFVVLIKRFIIVDRVLFLLRDFWFCMCCIKEDFLFFCGLMGFFLFI